MLVMTGIRKRPHGKPVAVMLHSRLKVTVELALKLGVMVSPAPCSAATVGEAGQDAPCGGVAGHAGTTQARRRVS